MPTTTITGAQIRDDTVTTADIKNYTVLLEDLDPSILTKENIGLGNVDNTSDINKPISSAVQAALDLKQNLGSGASTSCAHLTILSANTIVSQVTKDGNQICTTSDRPKDKLWYYSSKGDDLVNHKIGEGNHMTFLIPPGEEYQNDMQFLEDVWIKDCQVHYWGVEDHCHFSVEIICPAGIHFPASGNGNCDYNGSWVPNATGTGKYFILPTETLVNRFITSYAMMRDSHYGHIEAPEPQMIPYPYKIRFKVENMNTTDNLRACFIVGMYRNHTV